MENKLSEEMMEFLAEKQGQFQRQFPYPDLGTPEHHVYRMMKCFISEIIYDLVDKFDCKLK